MEKIEKSKKTVKTILIIFILIVISHCFIQILQEPKGKVYEEVIKGEKYYVLNGKYNGEYDLQRIPISKYEEFNTEAVLSYDEYESFVSNWGLDQVYTDSNKKYAVFANANKYSNENPKEINIGDIVINGETVNIYLQEDKCGGYSSEAYVIMVPVSKSVNNIKAFTLITKEQAENLKNYGKLFNPYAVGVHKPMIYIYPKKDMKVNVTLGNPSYLTTTYPKYNNGWNVYAKKDGTLIDNSGRSYYGLYWEGGNHEVSVKEDGFVIKGEETAKFLEAKLAILGLNEKEANEFIIYWLPRLEKNKYNYIRFETKEEIDSYMPLDISPTPDTLIRIEMNYKALDKKIEVKDQILIPQTRKGYTVVEWGGSEIQ